MKNRVTVRPNANADQVKLGRDFGRTVEVLDGVTNQDQLVLDPHDAIEDGEWVHARRPGAKPGDGA